jgi:hypothetical protein
MILELGGPYVDDEVDPYQLSARCPHCRHHVALECPPGLSDVWSTRSEVGQAAIKLNGFGVRRCPRRECLRVVFVIFSRDGSLLASFPPEVLDVETANLPEEIAESLTEAAVDHGVGSYRSAAIMLRRVLELVCEDHKVTGRDLKQRLDALGGRVVLPKGFADGLDALRFLGNDAAHLEARTYAEVGSEEVTLALDVVKLLLVNLYQTSNVIGRLQALQNKRQQEDDQAAE